MDDIHSLAGEITVPVNKWGNELLKLTEKVITERCNVHIWPVKQFLGHLIDPARTILTVLFTYSTAKSRLTSRIMQLSGTTAVG